MTAQPAHTPTSSDFSTILERFGRELDELHDLTIDLQASLGETLAAAEEPTAEALAGFQAIDRLAQTLEALALFARRLSSQAPSDATADAALAAIDIKLRDLAKRLAEDGVSFETSDGDCAFF